MTNVEKYIEARRARDAVEQAIRDEGPTPERASALKLAKAEAKIAYSRLTGGQIGQLRRMREIQ